MGAKQAGPISWNLETIEDIDAPEFENKYGDCLEELSKHVGEVANAGNIDAFQFLIHYTEMIMQSGFKLLKEVVDDQKSKTFEDFCKKVGITKN
jgi:hypothetical protein